MDPFESWWATYWKPMHPEVMNATFKEIAKSAWDAAEKKISTDLARGGNFALGIKFGTTYTLTNIKGVKPLNG